MSGWLFYDAERAARDEMAADHLADRDVIECCECGGTGGDTAPCIYCDGSGYWPGAV